MTTQEILSSCSFGARVAEHEIDELENYFVETESWNRIFRGDVDIIYGAKGSGKSAMYSLLTKRYDILRRRNIQVVSAEKPRGTPAFRDLQHEPPTSEQEFTFLWKLYFLAIANTVLVQLLPDATSVREVNRFLINEGLVHPIDNKQALLRSVFNYVKSFFRPPSGFEATVNVDPITGLPTGIGGRITFAEPDSNDDSIVSVDSLLKSTNSALIESNNTLWILLDRLDVAFAESSELETNAMRALFRVYLDFLELNKMFLKIFLRTDIWSRITRSGFREASHITRAITISWDRDSIANVVSRRILKNEVILKYYNLSPEETLKDIDSQYDLFYLLFPDQVDVGKNRPQTLDWILSRTVDGSRQFVPREVIHLLNEVKDRQLRMLEIGIDDELQNRNLFSRSAIRDSLPEVSKVRLQQTLFSEYPHLQPAVEALKGAKPKQTLVFLMQRWNCTEDQAKETAQELMDVGFFEQQLGRKTNFTYSVPFLYRYACDMI